MNKTFRIALAQMNATVGYLDGNEQRIKRFIELAKNKHADIVAFPELALQGYPPEDLLLKSQFINDSYKSLNRIISASSGITVILGFADNNQPIKNAAAVIHDGQWLATYYKIHLPNYGVFDERRYFEPGSNLVILELNHTKIGINICEDIWIPNSITEELVLKGGAEVIINISSSPYHFGKIEERKQLLISRAQTNRACICYVNLIGGQDELVFDGNSLIISNKGDILAQGKQFVEDLLVYDIDVTRIHNDRKQDGELESRRSRYENLHSIKNVVLPPVGKTFQKSKITPINQKLLTPLEEIYQALVLGTRDYILKNEFKGVVLGLSGGVDSALTAAIAVDAVGPKSVVGVSMPSLYSSAGSLVDASQLAKNLNIKNLVISIQKTVDAYKLMLKDVFQNLPEDIAEENIQARVRGNIVMALSNKFGWLPITTGNKSEISVGYCTLYGDMAGGFAVLKDVPKTMVYQISNHLNSSRAREIIPHNTLIKPPSAELRPDQKDEDSLPPYDILDPILELYVEKDYDLRKIIDAGFDEDTVKKVVRLVDNSEYKRRQGPPGVKITPKAFGKDRRMPITNRYKI